MAAVRMTSSRAMPIGDLKGLWTIRGSKTAPVVGLALFTALLATYLASPIMTSAEFAMVDRHGDELYPWRRGRFKRLYATVTQLRSRKLRATQTWRSHVHDVSHWGLVAGSTSGGAPCMDESRV